MQIPLEIKIYFGEKINNIFSSELFLFRNLDLNDKLYEYLIRELYKIYINKEDEELKNLSILLKENKIFGKNQKYMNLSKEESYKIINKNLNDKILNNLDLDKKLQDEIEEILEDILSNKKY